MTEQKPIVDTQNIKRRVSKHITMENHQFTNTTKEKKEKGTCKAAQKQ